MYAFLSLGFQGLAQKMLFYKNRNAMTFGITDLLGKIFCFSKFVV